jgi:hypothetical protein
MIAQMTREAAQQVLANLDEECSYELNQVLGADWDINQYADALLANAGIAMAAYEDDAAKFIGGFTWSQRPGVASTFLHHVPAKAMSNEIKREAIFAMRKAIKAITTPRNEGSWPPIWRVDCWSALGDVESTVRLYKAVGLTFEHQFDQYTVWRGPIWLFSKLAKR